MLRVTLSIHAPNEPSGQDLLTLDLAPSTTIKNLKDVIQTKTAFPAGAQHLYFHGRAVTNESQMLEEAGIKDGDMLAVLIRRRGEALQEQIGREGSGNRGDTDARLPRVDPEVERERQTQIALLNEDPLDTEAQRKIEELIRQDRIMENLQCALETNPEAFARVNMLYINAEVNGRLVKALVASCAQATIMSPSCAEACGIMRLLDTRYSGVAHGIGTARILGRVHQVELKIRNVIMPCAITIMEGNTSEFLFGLDMLKRHRAIIDLEKNALCIEGLEVPFLEESEIPRPLHESQPNSAITPGAYLYH